MESIIIPLELLETAKESGETDFTLVASYVSIAIFGGGELSLRAIAKKTNTPFSTFHKKILKLEEKGFITRNLTGFVLMENQSKKLAQESPEKHPIDNDPSKEIAINTTKNQSKKLVQESPEKHPIDKKAGKEHIEIAEFLARGIAHANPAFKQKNTTEKLQKTIEKWAEEIEKLCRIDNATPQQIIDVVTWLYSGKTKNSIFWQSNILSAKKLREKWETLVSKRISDSFEQKKEEKTTLYI